MSPSKPKILGNFYLLLMMISGLSLKITDRLHNMQTLDFMAEYKQVKIASETLYIYAPLSHGIGLYNIKTELEDLSFKYTEPDRYESIKSKIEK